MDDLEREMLIDRIGILIDHKHQLAAALHFQNGYEKTYPELAKAYSNLEQAFVDAVIEESKILSLQE